MDDLLSKLRYWPRGTSMRSAQAGYQDWLLVSDMMHDAADKIESLEDQLATLKAAFGETYQRRSSTDRWQLDTSA